MEIRPNFFDIKSYSEFIKYYWYRDELSKICKKLGIDHTGTKQELIHNLEEYFNGKIIKRKKRDFSKKCLKEIGLNCPLIECGFSFNSNFREYFSAQTGVENFKFTADMATAWRKVKKEHDTDFTIQNMLDIYYQKSDYAKYDNSSCQWNQFLKDFCADKENIIFDNKLKVASILWAVVKNSSNPKIYYHTLVENNFDLIKIYCKK
ncbi:SAP domain-containing protein [Paraclostridium dentum]|uniref:SAP domain-containing protein n=1 Tax=Paraclostridium dentum TaxID=2662455 RepID=UPI001474C26A|nr:SAP domain-containing protein [Paraclostridium dentum]